MSLCNPLAFTNLILLITCYLFAGAAAAQAEMFWRHKLDKYLTNDFFEERQPEQIQQTRREQRVSAPHDVGSTATELPDGFKNLEAKATFAQTMRKLEPEQSKKLSLADIGSKPATAQSRLHATRNTFFDDEDAAPRQEFSRRIPADKEPEPALFEQIGKGEKDSLALLDAAKAKEHQLQQHAKEVQRSLLLEKQKLHQQQLLEQEQQKKKQALRQSENENDDPRENARSAANFFESQGDFAGKDLEHSKALQDDEDASYEEEFVDDQESDETMLSQVGAKLSGHSLSGSDIVPAGGVANVGQTGEEGEEIHQYHIPELQKLTIPILTNEELVRLDNHTPDNENPMNKNVTQIYNKLKADTYTSAKRSTWRLKKQQEMETAIRRAQLLADGNRYKAELSRDQRLKAQEIADYERAVQLATDQVKQAGELKQQAQFQLQLETADGFNAKQAHEDSLEELRKELQGEKEKARGLQAEAIANVTTNLLYPAESIDQIAAVGSRTKELGGEYAMKHAQPSAMNFYEAVSRAADGEPPDESPRVMIHYLADNTPPQVDAVHHRGLSLAQEQAVSSHSIQEKRVPSSWLAAAQVGAEGNIVAKSMSQQSNCGGLGQLPCPGPVQTLSTEQGTCTPQCTWQCDNPKCDEVCEPECSPPRCETRCSDADFSGCMMECEEPHCAVVCPHAFCPSQTCAECQTTCSEPMCKLRCPHTQPCHNVCEHPSCEWKCRAPSACPAPQCHMVCETPKNCHGSTYESLPPLAPGEMAVSSFAAPVSFLQESATVSTVQLRGAPPKSSEEVALQMDVPVTQRVEDANMATPKIEQRVVTMSVMPRQ